MPVELNRDSTFKDVRQLLGRWMNSNPENVRFSLCIVDYLADLILCTL